MEEIHDFIKQYDEVRETSTEQGDDYTAVSILDDAYFKDNYRLIAVDLSKEKALDAKPRAIQQIVFQGISEKKLRPNWKIKRNIIRILQRNNKRFVNK